MARRGAPALQLRSFSGTSRWAFDSEPIPHQRKNPHCLDTHEKRSHPHAETKSHLVQTSKSPELSSGENVRYLREEEYSNVSGDRPYQLRAAHKEGQDLRYGGLENYKQEIKEIEQGMKEAAKDLNLR
jgi:hypothetical protein